MSDPSVLPRDPYRVISGDSLSAIARRCGRTVADLTRFNHLPNPDRLQVGQTLYLSEATAFGVSALFLDALRCPIQNLPYRLDHDGQFIAGTTDASGTIPRRITRSAHSDVTISVQTIEGNWQPLIKTASGYGNKLITLVSDAVVIKTTTDLHPVGVPLEQPKWTKPAVAAGRQAPLPKPAKGTPSKNNPLIRTLPAKGRKGQPIVEITVDLPPDLLALFAGFQGGEITEEDWEHTADTLECNKAVIKAIAKVESGGRNSFWRLNGGRGATLPAILYERHLFSRFTDHKYDKDHWDLSWRAPYQKSGALGNTNQDMHDGNVEREDLYLGGPANYLRLVRAYELDADAALRACSWGKFQILGDNFSLCGQRNARSFVQMTAVSEKSQIDLLSAFIQQKPAPWKNPKNKKLGKQTSLWDAVKTKNWAAIALNYNGPGYKTYSYDTKLEAAYKEYSKS